MLVKEGVKMADNKILVVDDDLRTFKTVSYKGWF